MTIFPHVAHYCVRLASSRISARCFRRALSSLPRRIASGHYQEGDRVLVSYKDGYKVKTRLLPPLRDDGKNTFGSLSWTIKHKDIIGQPARRIYVDATGQNGHTGSIRVTYPTLDDFVSLAPRTVTPIYASYSAFMTNLLDIHVDPPYAHNDPRTSNQPPLEILEAGTGHGSLTIHLAKAISAANPPPPSHEDLSTDEDLARSWQSWKASRRAIVHTVEFKASRSQDAEKSIRSYRGGLYWPHIDFHSGDAGQWINEEMQKRDDPAGFLDIVCLDMPGVHRQIQHVHRAMRNYSPLLVYVPQVTQLAACQQEIERLQMPLKLHQVVELGEGISNGRLWDLRFVKPRVELKAELERMKNSSVSGVTGGEDPALVIGGIDQGETERQSEDQDEDPSAPAKEAKFPTMVCRPMVGKLIMGGAFIGLWRKVAKS